MAEGFCAVWPWVRPQFHLTFGTALVLPWWTPRLHFRRCMGDWVICGKLLGDSHLLHSFALWSNKSRDCLKFTKSYLTMLLHFTVVCSVFNSWHSNKSYLEGFVSSQLGCAAFHRILDFCWSMLQWVRWNSLLGIQANFCLQCFKDVSAMWERAWQLG